MDTLSETAKLASDDQAAEKHAAYVLGRDLWFLGGWLSAVHEIASIPDRPWGWDPPYDAFGESFDSPPLERIYNIDDELLTLVQSRAVDAAVLVELHRVLDEVARKCIAITELIEPNQREEINELYWNAAYDLSLAQRLTKSLLAGNRERLEPWRQFGELLGESLHIAVHSYDPAAYPKVAISLIDLGHRLFPIAPMDGLDSVFRHIIPNSPDDTRLLLSKGERDSLVSHILSVDAKSVEHLRSTAGAEPYLEIDDKREVLIFLGVTLTFDEVQADGASGGLKLLRELVKAPSEFVSAEELKKRAELGCDASTLYSYVSHLRRVLKKTETEWPPTFKHGPDAKRARLAFIVFKRKPKSKKTTVQSNPEGPSYKLDLPHSRVRYEPRAQS